MPGASAPLEPPRKSALAFYAVLLLLFFPGMLAQAVNPPAGLAWTELFAFLLPAVAASAGSNLRPVAFLRLRRPPRHALLLGLLAGGAGWLVAAAIMGFGEQVFPRSWVRAFDLSRFFAGPPWERLLFSGLASLLAPVCEEIAFRGYLQSALGLGRRPGATVLLGAALFAAMHLDPVRFPALLFLGVLFGWLSWRAGSVWPAVAAHAANNGIATALALAAGPGAADERPGAAVLVSALVLGGAALALLSLAYRGATPAPPPATAAVEARDPSDASFRFSPRRLPPALVALALAGASLLVGVLLAGALAVRPGR